MFSSLVDPRLLVLLVADVILGLAVMMLVLLYYNTPDLIVWHKLRKQIDPFHSLSRRRKFKVAFCYLLGLVFGVNTAERWAHPFHDPLWRIRYWWQRLWVRKDEFHSSLNMDVVAMHNMTEAERTTYQWDLIRRRNIAHERDLASH